MPSSIWKDYKRFIWFLMFKLKMGVFLSSCFFSTLFLFLNSAHTDRVRRQTWECVISANYQFILTSTSVSSVQCFPLDPPCREPISEKIFIYTKLIGKGGYTFLCKGTTNESVNRYFCNCLLDNVKYNCPYSSCTRWAGHTGDCSLRCLRTRSKKW